MFLSQFYFTKRDVCFLVYRNHNEIDSFVYVRFLITYYYFQFLACIYFLEQINPPNLAQNIHPKHAGEKV